MSSLFLSTYVILWVVVAIQLLLLVLLYRQFGMMLVPGRSLVSAAGLDLGAPAPIVDSMDPASGSKTPLDWKAGQSIKLAIFAREGCPICSSLREPEANLSELHSAWPDVDFLWFDSKARGVDDYPDGWKPLVSPELTAHDAMKVPAFPFAYLVVEGRVAAKGVVNDRNDVDSLVAKQYTKGRGNDSTVNLGGSTPLHEEHVHA